MFVFILLVAFSGEASAAFRAVDLNTKIQSEGYTKKIDNFLVILDASGSMDSMPGGAALVGSSGQNKFETGKEILRRMNLTIPRLSINGGLRSFGFTTCLSWNDTVLNYGMTQYTPAGFQQGLDSQSCSSGGTPMGVVLDYAANDLASSRGNIAVFVVSDGNSSASRTLPYAQNLKEQFKDRICIYTVQVGDSERGKHLMQEIAKVGGCGAAVNATDIASAKSMGAFVENAFLKKGRAVPQRKVITDSDGDGVPDNRDKCPATPKGVQVNSVGCWVGSKVLFDTNKTDIKTAAFRYLNDLAVALKKYPDGRIEIDGHTDSRGNAAYNMGLSERRAKAVRDYLIKRGVNPNQMESKGFGLTQPLYTNKTREGRAKNRRVQLKKLR